MLSPVVSCVAEHQLVGSQPIGAAIASLRGNSCDSGPPSQINLQPLVPIWDKRRPTSSSCTGDAKSMIQWHASLFSSHNGEWHTHTHTQGSNISQCSVSQFVTTWTVSQGNSKHCDVENSLSSSHVCCIVQLWCLYFQVIHSWLFCFYFWFRFQKLASAIE